MNFRMNSAIAPVGNPCIICFESSSYTESPAMYSDTAIVLSLRSNLSIEFKVDNGLKKSTPTTTTHYSTPLDYDTNYQIYLEFAQKVFDVVHVLIVNKSAGAAHLDRTYATYSTNINCTKPIPDRLAIGDSNCSSNACMDWCLDNITAWQYSPDYSGVVLDESGVENAILAFGEQLLDIEYESNKFRMAYSITDTTWDTSPSYYLEPYIPTGCRDDVAGDIMESACLLYEYTGNSAYLTLAQDVWAVLQTHQQPDGGFTFGANTTDYCMHNARIILGLLALYRVTGDSDYLDEVEGIAPWMIDFQQAAGDCYSRVVRPATYTIDYDDVETGYFAVALTEAYKWMGNETYKDKAELALNYLVNKVTESGRVPSIPDGVSHADNNDVVNAGITLWALSEGYKSYSNETHLTKAEYVAKWLCYAQWANSTHAYGFWAGFMKDRANQSDILYNYVASLGLMTYQSIVPENDDVNGAINASLAFYTNAQSHSQSVVSAVTYGTEGVWGAAWNFNDTADQGWTAGWWAEGGWGTWGQIVFYGWQCNIIKFLLEAITVEPDGHRIFERTMMMGNQTGFYRGVFACSKDSTSTFTFTTSGQSNVVVTYADLANESEGNMILSVRVDADESVTTNMVLSSLSTNNGYRIYEDGQLILQQCEGFDTLTFVATGRGGFEIYVGNVDVTPPPLYLSSPFEEMTTGVPSVEVCGVSEPDVNLIVNGIMVAVCDDGSFSCVVGLEEGQNTLVVTATDAAGNSAVQSLNVTYVNPMWTLEDELETALANLTIMETALDAALEEISGLQTQLDDAIANLTTAEEESNRDLENLQEELDSVRDEVTKTNEDLADLKSRNMIFLGILSAVAVLAVLVLILSHLNLQRRQDAP